MIPLQAPLARTYKVGLYDTLWNIANAYGISLPQPEAANPTVVPELLTVGQIINLPAPTSQNADPSGINGSSAPTPPSSPPPSAATPPTSTEIPHGNRRR